MSDEDAVKKITDESTLVVFGSSWCGFCKKVMQALEGAGLKPNYVEVDSTLGQLLQQKTGKTSVPSVWIGDKYIGGCNDGPEAWMGTMPNLQNGNISKWIKELEEERK
jgi:glutaredoxin 3